MSQWGVDIVIGRLLTDSVFRCGLEQRRREWLTSIRDHGIDLDDAEIAALLEADARVWSQMALRIDRRLRRAAGTIARCVPLTSRQGRVLRGVFQGLTNKQIAASVGSSETA